jgi:hypothetical protein
MFGTFADSTPGRWGRTLIHRAELARARAAVTAPLPFGEVDVLLGVRDDLRQGALRFRLSEGRPLLAAEDSQVPVLTDLPALLDSAARMFGHGGKRAVVRVRAKRPDLADAGRGLLDKFGVGLAFLSTVRGDGGPMTLGLAPWQADLFRTTAAYCEGRLDRINDI